MRAHPAAPAQPGDDRLQRPAPSARTPRARSPRGRAARSHVAAQPRRPPGRGKPLPYVGGGGSWGGRGNGGGTGDSAFRRQTRCELVSPLPDGRERDGRGAGGEGLYGTPWLIQRHRRSRETIGSSSRCSLHGRRGRARRGAGLREAMWLPNLAAHPGGGKPLPYVGGGGSWGGRGNGGGTGDSAFRRQTRCELGLPSPGRAGAGWERGRG